MAGNWSVVRACRGIFVLLLAAFALPSTGFAVVPIYKCGNGADGVVYTDTPCKGGERLEIQPGSADPAALERLERARDALDRSADRRLANAEREAARKAESDWLLSASQQPAATQMAEDAYPYYDFGYAPSWYTPVVRPKRPRPRPLPAPAHQFAPNPPYLIPRR